MLLGIGRHEQFLLCFKCHVVRSCWDGFLGMRLDRCHFLLITIQSTDKIVLRIAACLETGLLKSREKGLKRFEEHAGYNSACHCICQRIVGKSVRVLISWSGLNGNSSPVTPFLLTQTLVRLEALAPMASVELP